MNAQQVAIVTGASTGIGRAIATRLARRGFTVFGTSRSPSPDQSTDGVQMLPLDVRSDQSVADLVAEVLRRASRIDVLVNNAGYQLMGAIEETTIDEAKAQFETNFFGAVRTTAAVLPTMRRQRSGKIINITSLFGFTGPPFLGFYAASKHALEGYSEVLRHEVAQFGISVSVVEPSATKTPINSGNRYAAPLDAYADSRKRVLGFLAGQVDGVGRDPDGPARVVERIVASSSPGLRYEADGETRMASMARRFLPEAVVERIWRKAFHLN